MVVFAPVAQAYESIAAYPILPAGYHSIKVFDSQSRFVGRLLPEKRYWVTIDRIPLFLQKAIVAVEDARFYEHGGVDLRGIARAAVKNVAKGRLAEGGSTITQQLVKNKYLSSEKSLDRKVNEGLMALELEKKYSKKQILEMYLNEIYYGNGAWGIAQAARIYFDKAPEELTDIECSFLAGIPKNPGRYNPLGKPVDVARRRSIVLQRMVDVGVLSSSQLRQQTSHTVAPVPPNQAPWYLALVHAKLVERYGPAVFEQGGLEVTSAMDLGLQLKAEQILHDSVVKLSPQLQGALVAVDPVSGNLVAAVGGTSYLKGGFNRAIQAKRQPGSSIKPLIYAAALEQGVTAASLWNDVAVSYPQGAGESWTPHNYDGKSHGIMTLRQALASSNNVIAVKLLETIGIPAFTEVAAKNGLALHGNNLSLALGTEEVTLHDLVLAYAPFATGGVRTEPRSILRIYETYRKVWFENTTSSSQALSPATAFITTSMLKDVLMSGTARGLKKFSQKYPAAGKTGTTNDYHDAWFIGYTPQLVAGVWVGHDQPKSGGKGFTGGAVAAPIWERFMRQALVGKPATDFVRPDSVVSVTIDPTNVLLATPVCPVKREEFFASGTEPDDYCPMHGGEPAAAPPNIPPPPQVPVPKP
ncbi:MAG: PBP1A family penicillin-binding protein [Trichlorobacter sp.]|uniref:transglycosylase domain-containing protein n=1 Tax=Trichlorobacter sp. TaxID=2911007 RepID=UPI00256B52C1|nr:PBP1A family penicillin-binding protein [Trichlorobacter sp.]MDK9716544.1 PBP1A family penicillin-binding protein [Trichlorobacter sp.]